MIKIFFLFFIIVFAFITAYEAILFEMKFYYNNNLKENQFHFFNNLYNSYLYTYLKIGQPAYDIKAIFSIFTPHFSLNPTFLLIKMVLIILEILLKLIELLVLLFGQFCYIINKNETKLFITNASSLIFLTISLNKK